MLARRLRLGVPDSAATSTDVLELDIACKTADLVPRHETDLRGNMLHKQTPSKCFAPTSVMRILRKDPDRKARHWYDL